MLCLLLAAHLFNTRPRSTLHVGKFGRDPPVYSTRVANSETVSGANNNNTILLGSSTSEAGVGAEVGTQTSINQPRSHNFLIAGPELLPGVVYSPGQYPVNTELHNLLLESERRNHLFKLTPVDLAWIVVVLVVVAVAVPSV